MSLRTTPTTGGGAVSTRTRALRSVAAALIAAVLTTAPALALPPAPPSAAAAPAPPAAPDGVWRRAQDLANYALGLLGVDYRFGGTSPEHGLDCSGLVRYVFQQVTGVTLPRTSRDLSHLGAQVSLADLAPGDLVFFNTRRLPFSHVGIYIGDDRFIHAPRRGGEVEIVDLSKDYWQKHFDGARRLIAAIPGSIPAAEAASIPPQTGVDSAPNSDGIRASELDSPQNLLP